ncbi:hypothetical protein Tco_0425235 [Tanacetum coccineum]
MKVTFPSGSELKITPKKIWEVLGIPMGKKKLKSDSPREYDDELLKAFKLVYLHYTKIDSMVMMQRKWPAIRNWTSQDVVDRENFDISPVIYHTKFNIIEERAGTSGVGNGDGNEDGADNNEVDVEQDNEPTKMGIDDNKASEMREVAEKEAVAKEKKKLK